MRVGRRLEVRIATVVLRAPSAPCEPPVMWKTRPLSPPLAQTHIQPHTAAGGMEAASKASTHSYLRASN